MPTLRSQAHWQVAQKADTQPKPAKELANPIARADRRMKHENTTMYIKHLADSVNFKAVIFNENCGGMTGLLFEMPNVSYTWPLCIISE